MKISLKAARVNAEFTQEEIAEKMGVSRATVNNWETGKTKIGTPQLFMFCDICKANIDFIVLPNGTTVD